MFMLWTGKKYSIYFKNFYIYFCTLLAFFFKHKYETLFKTRKKNPVGKEK